MLLVMGRWRCCVRVGARREEEAGFGRRFCQPSHEQCSEATRTLDGFRRYSADCERSHRSSRRCTAWLLPAHMLASPASSTSTRVASWHGVRMCACVRMCAESGLTIHQKSSSKLWALAYLTDSIPWASSHIMACRAALDQCDPTHVRYSLPCISIRCLS